MRKPNEIDEIEGLTERMKAGRCEMPEGEIDEDAMNAAWKEMREDDLKDHPQPKE